ncbi:MAG: hypothetical protein E6G96_16810 [Alphaproteobacteria bacterium]|nr:MAG: hypothetical protein E6G96_16810 [Alphaproteobacteria bacterium]
MPEQAQRTDIIPAHKAMRPIYFDGALRQTPIYERDSLAADMRLQGPAVIEEFGSTTVIFPGQELAVDPHGILIIRPAPRPGAA